MFKFFKNKSKNTHNDNHDNQPTGSPQGLFSKFKAGLKRSRNNIANKLANLFYGKKEIDAQLLAQLETLLLTADLGAATTKDIIQSLTQEIKRQHLKDPNVLMQSLGDKLIELLTPYEKPLTIPQSQLPFVILVVGVNGAGKTTTIGKITAQLQASGKKVLLAAGDTFRAGAVAQLKIWGERNGTTVISQDPGADSASVIFDAFEAAKARGYDVLIADTAGRLHTQGNLMEELKKIDRVIKKIDPCAPHETLLVLDASLGQNSLAQAKQFHQALTISGIALTKLDGTAQGGILFALTKMLQLPIRYLGLGEQIDDLNQFNAHLFVEALLTNTEEGSQHGTDATT